MRGRLKWLVVSLIGLSMLPRPAGAQDRPLTLQEAVSLALSSSIKIKMAEAERNAQTERRRGAWSDIGPRVKAEYNQVRFPSEQSFMMGPQEIVIRPKETKTGSVMIAQPITGAAALLDKARFEGTQEDVKEIGLRLARGDAAFQAAEAWLKAYQAQRQLEIATASISAAETQLKDAGALERAGRMNHGDTLKLELAVSEARARAAEARAGRDSGLAALREATGVAAEQTLTLAGAPPEMAAASPSEGDLTKEALTARLETQQADSGVVAAEFGKKLAYTQFTPGVNVFVKWDHNFGELGGIGGGERNTRTYGVQATWDLWNNGSHIFAVREAAENVIRAEEARRGLDQQIRLDVVQALANLRAAQESLALAKVAVSQASEAYRIEKVRFRTGSRSATDLILAETSEAGAKGRLVTAETNLVLWHLRLQRARGTELPQFQ